jgi:hypothetical protein
LPLVASLCSCGTGNSQSAATTALSKLEKLAASPELDCGVEIFMALDEEGKNVIADGSTIVHCREDATKVLQ